MSSTYTPPRFEFRRPPELDTGTVRRYPVVVVGAGPVGLTTALDCRRQGIPAILLDDDDTVSAGSRGLCYAKRTLEVLDRCGVGDPVVDKGVTWNVGRTFFREGEVFSFNLLPEPGFRRPGMVNLQQYWLEEFLVDGCVRAEVDLRWKNRVAAVRPMAQGAAIDVETPEGNYTIEADWVIVCDGARSPIRRALGLDVEGQVFRDRFLIADVVMKAPFPAERWFWFDPPFHRNQSVLLHRQAGDLWRIDFQLGYDVNPDEERKPENVIPRIQAMLGKEHPFELEWVSIYTFQCRRMQRFNHGRVVFAGDSAHQVSPFGARGANSGIQDADNLVWKLRLVLDGLAPESLIDSYTEERTYAADENILNSTRSTDFITPRSATSRAFRDAALHLARTAPFARGLVNSGRLSIPALYDESSLNTPADEPHDGWMRPGAPLDDAPVLADGLPSWLLAQTGNRFQLVVYAEDPRRLDPGAWRALALNIPSAGGSIPVEPLVVALGEGDVPGVRTVRDIDGHFARRFDAQHGSAFLVRPDQHIAARWRSVQPDRVLAALARATAQPDADPTDGARRAKPAVLHVVSSAPEPRHAA